MLKTSNPLALAVLFLAPSVALAHTRLIFPPPRDDVAHKTGPCGGVPRTGEPLVLVAGQELEVEWEEYIDHPGYYQVSFSSANDQGFVMLPHDVVDRGASGGSNIYRATVTLPSTPCEEGTLQVIQVMTENPQRPSLYFSCADVRLVEAPPTPIEFRRGDTDADGEITLTDAVRTFEHLFLGGEEPPCSNAADSNDDGDVNLSDGIHTLNWLFLGGPPPADPGPETCGEDPSGDGVDCASYPPCQSTV